MVAPYGLKIKTFLKTNYMTKETLQKAKELEAKLNTAEAEYKSFKNQVQKVKNDYSGKGINLRNDDLGWVKFRKKSLISYLETEAQYWFQEAQRISRELNRL